MIDQNRARLSLMAPRPDFGKAVDETGTNNCVWVTILSRHWGGACVSFSNIFSNKHSENSIGICLHNDLFIFRTKIDQMSRFGPVLHSKNKHQSRALSDNHCIFVSRYKLYVQVS